MGWVLIVGGGALDKDQLSRELTNKPDLVIAADSGAKSLLDQGYFPQILVGDFDSLASDLVQKMSKAKIELFTYPTAKDETDMELAVDLALDRGASEIRILGGTGGRLDHTLGNVGLLLKAYQKGVVAYLVDLWQEVTLTGSRIELQGQPGLGVSLIPLTLKVEGVTTTGLKYPLIGADLYFHRTRGIHNEFVQDVAAVSLTEGILLVISLSEKGTNQLSSQK
ncbi:MAG: thiamine diphosphokinase [Firmicutes bacterium]|nr:thiamine diphosphokinase [Bacillota bacterium]